MPSLSHHTTPEYLCIGLLCHDVDQTGYRLGGTAAYASLLASKLGKNTAVLTRLGNDFRFLDVFEQAGIIIQNKTAANTTVFDNRYVGGERTQFITHPAGKLSPADIPKAWKASPIVHLCLIANELDFDTHTVFPHALIGASIQGWLRQWDQQGKIHPKQINWEKLSGINVVFISESDIDNNTSVINHIIDQVPLLVVTKGKQGATIFTKDHSMEYPVYPAKEIDPTGAGDIFAAAFLTEYHLTGNIPLSMAFAHAAASCIVEVPGTEIPPKEQIHQRFSAYKEHFLN